MNKTPNGWNKNIKKQAFIDGKYVDALDGASFDTVNPATGKTIASVASCTDRDIDAAVKCARAAFEKGSWSQSGPTERKETLLALADGIEENGEELAWLEVLETGKPITDAKNVDIAESVECLRWYAELGDKLYDQIAPTDRSATALIVREPIGVVGAVVPWNFPLLMAMWKIAPALAAGNSVVLKPAELTPLTALRVGELANEAGLPAGVLNVIPGFGETAGRAIGLHPDIDMVTFTGSTDVGREFLRYSAASNLKKIHLECGGKSPCIVLRDANDLAYTAEQVAAGILWNQGENCSASSRLLVDEAIKDELIEHVVRKVQSWPVGDPMMPETRLGALIEPAHLKKVADYVQSGLDEGARPRVLGNQVLQDSGGWFLNPTVFDGVSNSMKIAQEEIFGPVLSVISFADEDEAIRIANDTSYGLAACLWTRDVDKALTLSRQIRAGTVAVNSYSEGNIATPFGGFKLSGFGGRDKSAAAMASYSAAAMASYVETKTIWIAHR